MTTCEKAPFHNKVSESSYATKFDYQDSPSLLPFPLIVVVRLMIRTVTKFCSLLVNDPT